MALLFHITRRDQWDRARFAGYYRADTLDTEGFIHCSTKEQVSAVANRFFRGQQGLVLLFIDSTKVQATIQFDAVETGERFPHIYGPINTDAVIRTRQIAPGPDGHFEFTNDLLTASPPSAAPPTS